MLVEPAVDRGVAEPAMPPPMSQRTATILVIEDDDLDFAVIEAVLLPTGHRIARDPDLESARRRLLAEEIDLVISDLLLPDGVPTATMASLEAMVIARPVIVVTGWSTALARHFLTGPTRLHFFDKNNFNPKIFLATVQTFVKYGHAGTQSNPFADRLNIDFGSQSEL